MPESAPVNKTSPGSSDSAESAAAESGLAAERKLARDEAAKPLEKGGPAGPEPTRYGDWERKGRCIDF
jgi:hypothetical protein